MPDAVIYDPSIDTDKKKLFAVYSLLEQMRLEHNRQGAIARGNREKYIEAGKWYRYALRPKQKGGSCYRDAMKPLLQECNAIKDKIRKASYTDAEWRALSDEEKEAAMASMFGNRATEAVKPTLASYDGLTALKAINLDDVPNTEFHGTEDFTTYTEVDPSPYFITITADRITVTNIDRDDEAYVYDDKGAGHFGDFEHWLATSYGSTYDTNIYLKVWAVSNTVGTNLDMVTASDGMVLQQGRSSGGQYNFQIRDYGEDNADSVADIPKDEYWHIVERDGSTLSDTIYDDADRTSEISGSPISVTCETGTKRYVYGFVNSEIAAGYQADLYVEYLDLSPTAHYDRSGTALLGLLASGSRGLALGRSGTGLLGLLGSGSRALGISRSGTALLGLKATGSRALAMIRSGTALLGLKAVGTMETVGHYIRSGTALLGLLATGSRTLAMSRSGTALLGLKGSASKSLARVRSGTALLGLLATGSRTISISRSGTALLGLLASGTAALSAVGRRLKIKITTAQHRSMKIITTQYRKIKIFTLGE